MAVHNQLGKLGEEMAAAYLERLEYTILHRNWRHSRYEIDIIALKGKVLHFIEVKIRSSSSFGLPEDSVTRKKFRSLQNGADEFLYQHPQFKHVQYDILAITTNKSSPPAFFLIEDVYL